MLWNQLAVSLSSYLSVGQGTVLEDTLGTTDAMHPNTSGLGICPSGAKLTVHQHADSHEPLFISHEKGIKAVSRIFEWMNFLAYDGFVSLLLALNINLFQRNSLSVGNSKGTPCSFLQVNYTSVAVARKHIFFYSTNSRSLGRTGQKCHQHGTWWCKRPQKISGSTRQ